ncbi:chemotaxis response regulator protein-glutamate methylesterase [Massilia sp. CFBP9012]|uniref:protein-glutamate methylesterase/protein-glutamine glutaminase n=1 Tax=Massilia sp. CFBP9012 TaxID=3096531 RepID=UPI002A6A9B0C|nr:chemotaxis response regulator protein-glutamate methylesterase [Massilia sp. CFBP9012]MDY0975961.1 chemotaxis response regulator protein-glutamate methylesterase [Massilia sp. CFBP9012]
MIVDDSAVVRQVASEILGSDPAIEVIGVAADPILAMAKMKNAWPDVILLDIEMPKMDGLTFLRRIMAERPTAVVICSTLTEQGARTTVEALAAGAVTTIGKPRLGLKQFLNESTESFSSVVKAAARANVGVLAARARSAPVSIARAPGAPGVPGAPAPKLNADAVLPPGGQAPMTQTTERVVAIGTSTGGTQALEQVLTALPQVAPGIVIVQHMPEKFTAAFAARLDSICRIRVLEARHGMRVIAGQALLAPGGKHLLLRRSGAQYHVDVVDGPLVNRHRPSVDVLFRSVAKSAGANALGIIMTGMGDDGAAGLFEMKQAGAATVAQDEASCVVYGMPKEAVKRGGVERSLPLRGIAGEIMKQLRM